ncbi:MAG TPA: hypothetical protein VMY35_12190 [Phycisphaerae bacterium]|nr:hypothetical protein [Phycisphaerae bacterium]
MADSTLDSELFVLDDHWPGEADPRHPEPSDGFASAYHHNTATRQWPIGTKIMVRNHGAVGDAGQSTFIYLQMGVQNPLVALAAKQVVVQYSATKWYRVTNDPDTCLALPTGLAAIAIAAMTDEYYGWFWCGGSCPEEYVAGLGGDYATDGNVVPGEITAHDLQADAIGIGPRATTEGCLGFALDVDAA